MSHLLKAQVDAEDTIIVDSWVSKKQVRYVDSYDILRRCLSQLRCRKFKRLLCWAYAPKIRYSLSSLPLSANWGTQGFDSRFLCYRGEPVTICIVGSIQAYTLSCEQGRPSTVDLTLELLRDADRDAMVRLLEMANPPPRMSFSLFFADCHSHSLQASFPRRAPYRFAWTLQTKKYPLTLSVHPSFS